MATITIPIETYQDLQESNDNLNQENLRLKHINTLLKDTVDSTLDILEEVKEASLFERLFKWGDLCFIVKEYIRTLEEKEKLEFEKV